MINREIPKVFLKFLREVFEKTYLGTADKFEESFTAWLSTMTHEQMINFADLAIELTIQETMSPFWEA